MDLLAYLRISRDEDLDKLSPDVQLDQIQKWADRNGHRLVGVFTDRDISGGVDFEDRPGWCELWESIKPLKAHGIVCLCLDRLVRDLRNQCNIVFAIKRRKLGLFFTQQEFDDSPEGLMLMQMLGIFAEQYRHTIGRKVKDHARYLASRGQNPCGQAPIGYVWDSARKQFLIDEARVDDARAVFDTFIECGGNRRQTVLRLVSQGIMGRRGKPWTTNTVARVVGNPFYSGFVRYQEIQTEIPDLPRIIDPVTLDTAAQLLKARATHKSKCVERSLPYATWITCGQCGRHYVGYSKAGRWPIYTCGGRVQGGCKAGGIAQKRLDSLIGTGLESLLATYAAEVEAAETVVPKRRRKKSTANAKARLIDLYETGVISKTELMKRLEKYEEEAAPVQVPAINHGLEPEIVRSLSDHWSRFPASDKQRLLPLLVSDIVLVQVKPAVIRIVSEHLAHPLEVSEAEKEARPT